MKLSDQAIGAIMMALQNSLMEQTDIVPVFRGFELQLDEKGNIMVLNPPMIKKDDETKSPSVQVAEVAS